MAFGLLQSLYLTFFSKLFVQNFGQSVSRNKTLNGSPKLLFFHCCRGPLESIAIPMGPNDWTSNQEE
jgi:hypothetical protein